MGLRAHPPWPIVHTVPVARPSRHICVLTLLAALLPLHRLRRGRRVGPHGPGDVVPARAGVDTDGLPQGVPGGAQRSARHPGGTSGPAPRRRGDDRAQRAHRARGWRLPRRSPGPSARRHGGVRQGLRSATAPQDDPDQRRHGVRPASAAPDAHGRRERRLLRRRRGRRRGRDDQGRLCRSEPDPRPDDREAGAGEAKALYKLDATKYSDEPIRAPARAGSTRAAGPVDLHLHPLRHHRDPVRRRRVGTQTAAASS